VAQWQPVAATVPAKAAAKEAALVKVAAPAKTTPSV
jgi:hypothetical protein